ncbi:MAG: DUF433 domain-containing protein [Anaerolineae bacterium]
MSDAPVTVDLSKYIDRHFFEERPHVRDRRVSVATIAYSARENNWNSAEVAENYGLSEEQVLAALLYYHEHAAEIDAQEAEYAAVPVEDWVKYGEDALLLRRNDAPRRGE